MNADLERQLAEEYPLLFEPSGSMAFGCECGDGWHGLIRAVCKSIDQHQKHLVKNGQTSPCPTFSQIKEKYGGLRLYFYGGDSFVEGVVDLAERLSYQICERCGDRGKPNDGGWITTLCDKCRT